MATIRRTRHTSSFVTLANAVARDRRLSHRARGVLIWILSLPPDANVNSDQLAKDTADPRDDREGREAIRSAMRDLERVGYARLIRTRNAAGQISSEWHVGDDAAPKPESPTTENQATVESGEIEPKPENPSPAQPTPVNQAPLKRHLRKQQQPLGEEEEQTRRLLTVHGINDGTARRLAELRRPLNYVRGMIARAAREADDPPTWIIAAINDGDYIVPPTADEQAHAKADRIAEAAKKRDEIEAHMQAERDRLGNERAAAACLNA